MVARCSGSGAATCPRWPWIRRTKTPSTAHPSYSGGPTTVASRGRPCAVRPAAMTTRKRGSIPITPTSCSSYRIRVAWSPPTAASRGATGTPSRRRRCITSPRTTSFRIESAAASRTRDRHASPAARWTARSPSTTGIPSTFRNTASPPPIPRTPTRSSAACATTCRCTTAGLRRRHSSDRRWTIRPNPVDPDRPRASTETSARCRSGGRRSNRGRSSTCRTWSGKRAIAASTGPGSARISPVRAGRCRRPRANTPVRSRRAHGAPSPRSRSRRYARPCFGQGRMMEISR